jgi:cyclophilin family peptidyl-prolyl cis-trans isomerase
MANGSTPPESYHIFVYGRHADGIFQKYKVAAEYLSQEFPHVEATVEGFFETQYEQQLKHLVRHYGGSFAQAKVNAPLVFAETPDAILFFATGEKFLDWALRRFKYEDTTHKGIYRRVSALELEQVKQRSGRSYVSLGFNITESQAKQERFDENACRVLISGIPSSIEAVEDEVKRGVEGFGPIVAIEPKDKGVCFVTFDSGEVAQNAIANSSAITIGGTSVQVERVVQEEEFVQFELFDEECPILCKSFRDIVASPNFNGHKIHRVKTGAWIQGGDLVDSSGNHSEAIAGGTLRHESFVYKHDRPGLLGMCCHGQDTIGSQYYITLRDLPFLDGKFVVIGRVISGMRTLHKISKTPTKNERPLNDVTVGCDIRC